MEHRYCNGSIYISPIKNSFHIDNLTKVKLAVILFDAKLDEIMNKKSINSIGGFKSGIDYHPYYVNDNILFVNSFLGGPNAAGLMEELSAIGIKHFISFGGAGSISKDFYDQYLVVNYALRDEGTSYHYIKPDRYVSLDQHLKELTMRFMDMKGIDYTKGNVWTTDAYYTESESLIFQRRNENILAVDMECSTWAAVAKAKQLSFCQVLFCTDYHSSGCWKKVKNRNEKREFTTKLAIECAENLVKQLHD